jgi:hypothetical protein
MVHYQPHETQDPLAAVIIAVDDKFDRSMLDIHWTHEEEPLDEWGKWYPYAEVPTPGHWNWPPRA